jgi:hypothetical protein
MKGWNWGGWRTVGGLARLLALLFAPLPIYSQYDPFTLWTWSDGIGNGRCTVNTGNNSDEEGCCGSPGRRECAYVVNWGKVLGPGCTDPDQNIVRNDSYEHKVVCNLGDTPSVIPPLVLHPQNVTFYVGADYHVFRGTFSPLVQAYFPTALGAFSTSKTPWPSGTGIPAGDTVDPPLALVIAGDMTTGGGIDELGAYRTVWEAGTLAGGWSFPFAVFPGLGNHDLVDAGTGGAGAGTSAQRMWDYVGKAMQFFNMDNSAVGLLGVNDGQGTHNYSWDWGGVHYVQLNTWAGETNQYNGPISNGLAWLANDLAKNVGNSTKPVVLFQHYDLLSLSDSQGHRVYDSMENQVFQAWWNVSEYTTFWNIIRDYNVIGTFSGHVHAWDMQRPEHYTAYDGVAGSSLSLPVTDSQGRAKIYDVYRLAPLGSGNFFSARVTPDYLDVAAWNSALAGLPPEPITNSPMWGGAASCRKKINTRFVDVSGLVQITGPDNGTYQIQNTSQLNIPGPLAVKIYSDHGSDNLGVNGNVANRSFVDSCDRYFGDAYVLSTATNLAAGQSIQVPVQLSLNKSITVRTGLVQLQPLGYEGAILASPGAIAMQTSNPPDQDVYYYTPPGVALPLTTSISYQDNTTGWLSVQSIAGANGASGGYRLSFDANILSGLSTSTAALLTLTSTSGDTVTIPVTVRIRPSLILSTNSISFDGSPAQLVQVTSSTGAAVPFQVAPATGFTVSPTNGTTPAFLTVTPSNVFLGPPGTYQRTLTVTSLTANKVSAVVNLSVDQVVVSASGTGSIPLTVDGVNYSGSTGPMNWVTGTSHEVATVQNWQGNPGQQFRFVNWTYGGQTSSGIGIRVVAPPYGAPVLYQAGFNEWDKLILTSNPAAGGSVNASPSAPDGYYSRGAAVSVGVVANPGYYFSQFAGTLTGYQSPQVITMDGARNVEADFNPTNGAGQTTIATSPPGAGFVTNYQNRAYVAPATFYWDAGQAYTVTVPPQQTSPATQVALVRWNDGDTSLTRSIAGIHGGSQTFTAILATQYLVTATASPAGAGTVNGAGFVTSGTAATLTATASPGFVFAGFSGDVTSPANGASVTVTRPLNVQANFTATAPPSVIAIPGAAAPSGNTDLVTLNLTLRNSGIGPAGDATITGIDGFKDLIGSGADGTAVFTPLPFYVGTLNPGQSLATSVNLVWPSTATRMHLVVHFSANKGTYTGSTALNVFR